MTTRDRAGGSASCDATTAASAR